MIRVSAVISSSQGTPRSYDKALFFIAAGPSFVNRMGITSWDHTELVTDAQLDQLLSQLRNTGSFSIGQGFRQLNGPTL
jgi:hypothetical protein